MEAAVPCQRLLTSALHGPHPLLPRRGAHPRRRQHDVVDKIKPLWDSCLTTYTDYFTPPAFLTVDEIMERFKGRSSWKIITKSNPTPIGYKVWAISGLGYLRTFDIYRGKGVYKPKPGTIHRNVISLVQRWAGSHRTLFSDNLFTSPNLCRHLVTLGLRTCGTFHAGRHGLPTELKDVRKAIKAGEVKAWQSGEVGCVVWGDKVGVLMLSTIIGSPTDLPPSPSRASPSTTMLASVVWTQSIN